MANANLFRLGAMRWWYGSELETNADREILSGGFLDSGPRSIRAQLANTLLLPLRGVGFVFVGIYKIFFSWWMNPLLNRSMRKSSATEIEQAFPFLFNEFGAKLVPCPRPQAHDSRMNYVCCATANVLFEFSTWHGEYTAVRVAPTFDPRDSYDLTEVINIFRAPGQALPATTVGGWRVFARMLEPQMPKIETALSAANFSETRSKLRPIKAPTVVS